MAVLSTIRKRVGLVIGIVGMSMVLFILGDVLTSSQGLFGSNSNVLAEVSGDKITAQEFESRVETMIKNYKASTQNDNIDENTTEMIREQAWSTLLNENILGKQYKAVGVSCSPAELYDMCAGKNIHAQVRQAFTDPKTGAFNPAEVVKFLKDLPNRDEKIQMQWKSFEEGMRTERLDEKYKNVIKGGLYVTKAEAKADYYDKNRNVNIRFFQLNYLTVPDSSVKVEDSDLDTYYSAHKKEYEQKENMRKLDYVVFEVTPSAEDRNDVIQWVNDKKAAFSTATNDTIFVNQNSDVPFDSSYHAKGTLPLVLDTILFSAPQGTLVGPYEDGGRFKISKLTSSSMVADSAKASHILIKINNNDTAKAMAKADSLRNMVRKGTPFEILAMTNSEDPGSAVKGGDLGWFRKGMMVKPFEDAAFKGNKGDLTIVESQFGIHLIKVVDKGALSRQIQVATVERAIEPSQKTYDAAYNKAMQFAASNQDAEKFDSAVVKEGLNKRTADNLREADKNIAGLDKPREIIRWAFGAKLHEVSKVFTLGDKYVIAQLVDIKEKGTLPLEQVKDQVTASVRKEKKGVMLAEKITSQSSGGVDIMALAQKLGQNIFPAGNINFSSTYVQGMGNEPKVVGQIFALKKDQMSKPIKGDNGVYVVVVDLINEPPAPTDLAFAQKQVADGRKQRSDYEVFNALKEKANVVDNRGKFY